jgi:hypothetical protein
MAKDGSAHLGLEEIEQMANEARWDCNFQPFATRQPLIDIFSDVIRNDWLRLRGPQGA